VDWARPATVVHNQIRGLQPWPVAAAELRQNRVRLWRSAVVSVDDEGAAPGHDCSTPRPMAWWSPPARVACACSECSPTGRAAMAVRDFLNGHLVAVGDRFTPLAARS
jgi:methionyl-tRNA formyltransferase